MLVIRGIHENALAGHGWLERGPFFRVPYDSRLRVVVVNAKDVSTRSTWSWDSEWCLTPKIITVPGQLYLEGGQ